jgi:hypothetical protein
LVSFTFFVICFIQALLGIHEPEEAKKRFEAILQFDSNNKAAANQVVICNARIREQPVKDKKLYPSIFNKMAENDRQLRQVNSCHADIASPNFYFATKTSYKFIKNTNTDEITLRYNSSEIK